MDHSIPTIKTVRVLLLNFDGKQFAIFRMAFKMHNATNYVLLPEDTQIEPDLVIVDGDMPHGDGVWHEAKRRYSTAKVVYFSSEKPQFTTPYLAKPIRFDTLFINLRSLLQGNGIWVPNVGSQRESMHTPRSAQQHANVVRNPFRTGDPDTSVVKQNSSASTANTTTPPTTARKQAPSVQLIRFNPEGSFLNHIQKLVEQGQDIAVLHEGKPIVVLFPAEQNVLLATDVETIQDLCNRDTVSIETKLIPPSNQLHDKAKIKVTAFVWQLAIWTVKGRLIEPITTETILKLKSWPNMTRMAFLPESMRLSAFLVKTPVSLAMLYKLLPVDIKDILNFIAATYATGYLQIQQPLLTKVQSRPVDALPSRESPSESVQTSTIPQRPTTASQPKGVLQRLMSRLRGK